jgi:hypothetical protein
MLKSWSEYYYEEGGVKFKGLTTSNPGESCKMIRELNPNADYFDLSGKAIFYATGSIYLMEKSEDGLHRVLFIGE